MRVDDMLTKFLRAHQREGLQFLFDCVTGLKPYDGQGWCVRRFRINACCLAPVVQGATVMHASELS